MRHMTGVVCVLALAVLAGCSSRQGPASAEQEIRALAEEWMAAYAKGDVATIDRIEAADAVLTDAYGSVLTKADDLAEVRSGAYALKSWANEEMRVRLLGDTAVAHGVTRTEGTYKGRDFSHRTRWTDTWVRKDGRWQCAASHNSRIVGDPEAAKAEVNAFLDQWIGSFETEDMTLLPKLIARDSEMVFFGTDAAEIWIGYDPLMKALEKQFASTEQTKVVLRDRFIRVAGSANAAWFSEVWDMAGKAQGQPYTIPGIRMTGGVEKRNGTWVIVQGHASIPVAGQAIKY